MYIEEINLFDGFVSATLTAYIQNSSSDGHCPMIRPAILICPGGAFISITEKEAEPVALKFVSVGYHAFVLKYSIGAGIATFPAPFIDAAKAMILIRQNANKWMVDSNRITLCGFSTGGLIASIVGTSWQDELFSNVFKEEINLIKPNTLILGYPLLNLATFEQKHLSSHSSIKSIIEMMFSSIFGTSQPSEAQLNEWNVINKVTVTMPPTFMWTTLEDRLIDVEDSLDFAKMLSRHKIIYEYHAFEKGNHGLSLGDKSVGYSNETIKEHLNTTKWVDLALNWLERHHNTD